jgi:hypothetical protein
VISRPIGRGKYKNDTIDKILQKRKNEINQSISSPNNIIQEEYNDDFVKLPTKKISNARLYQAKEPPVRYDN